MRLKVEILKQGFSDFGSFRFKYACLSCVGWHEYRMFCLLVIEKCMCDILDIACKLYKIYSDDLSRVYLYIVVGLSCL